MQNSKPILLSIVFFILISCNEKKAGISTLGDAHLEVTGNKSAQPFFAKGLLLLHSFEYEDAREEFILAQQADPKMLMAFWGEALTYNHTLWAEQDFAKATVAIQKLYDADAMESMTAIEKDFIHALTLLYAPQKTKAERDIAFSEYLNEMYKKYPDNQEVAAFYALSVLGTVQEGRDIITYEKGADIAQKVLRVNPNHPGALHYLIHAYDDPEHAHLALDAANKYAKVAPDAAHALHMPSHIYIALGMWDELINSNEHSYKASIDRMQRKQLSNDARGYHSYHWLQYGYLQKSRNADAEKMIWDMQTYVNETPSERSKSHFVYLKGTYLVETNAWDSPVANLDIDISDLNVAVRAQYRFIEGMKAFKKRNTILLDTIIAQLHADYMMESMHVAEVADAHCASLDYYAVNQTNINECIVTEMQLLALRAWMKKDNIKTEEWLKKSVDLYETMSFTFGPPSIQKPTHELYADWLMLQNRPEEAKTEYEKTLQRAPNRLLAMQGKLKAEELIGLKQTANAQMK